MLIAQTDAEELPSVTVNPYFSFGAVTKTVSEMKQHLNEFSNEELVKVAKTGNDRYSLVLLASLIHRLNALFIPWEWVNKSCSLFVYCNSS